jgi:hypothetical protein
LLDLCNDDDVDSQRQALMCLVNVTSNEANHPAVMSKGTLKVLMRLAALPGCCCQRICDVQRR